jgi:peptide/nickel transport system substrate-binding protein
VDRIEWTFGGTSEEHVDAVANGEADYMVQDVPPSRVEDLRVRFAGQVHEHPMLSTLYLFLDTALPPFDDVDVRRALNLAVDRRRIVELHGGPTAAALTCQILPPNFPGYEPYCPYTIGSGSGGQWTGSEMEEARRLVRHSGTAGTHVTFWFSPVWADLGVSAEAEAEYFVQLLEELGFVADVRSTGSTWGEHFRALEDPDRGIQIAPAGWVQDYPAASHFFTNLLTCGSLANYGAFCDPEVDAMVERAARIQTDDPAASGEAWAEVDRAITDQAPWVPLVNRVDVDFVSERLENYQYNPQWFLLLAQVWVR